MLLVMGSGSVGSLFGGQLADNGYDVILVGRGEHITTIKKSGLTIKGLIDSNVAVKAVISVTEAKKQLSGKKVSLVLVTTKAHQTAEAAEQLKEIITKDTVIIAIQNGIGTEQILRNIFYNNVILRGVTSIGVCRPHPGLVEFTGKGKTLIDQGNLVNREHAETIVEIMQSSGIDAHIDRNIQGSIFTKTIVNCALNPLTAIHNVKNIEIFKQEALREKATLLAKEAWNVTKAIGIKLTVPDPIAYTFQVIKKTGENTNSMLTDVLNKRKTEIDFLNGKIITLGKKFGTTVINNKEIYEEIVKISKNFSKSKILT